MENHLNRVMDDVLLAPSVIGCVFVDHQGLCLGAKGKASTESSGIICAVAEQVLKLEPQNRPPTISFESGDKMCTIQRCGTVTGAIYSKQ